LYSGLLGEEQHTAVSFNSTRGDVLSIPGSLLSTPGSFKSDYLTILIALGFMTYEFRKYDLVLL
jgi:hypothetical protein